MWFVFCGMVLVVLLGFSPWIFVSSAETDRFLPRNMHITGPHSCRIAVVGASCTGPTDLTFVPCVFSGSPTLRVLDCVCCVYPRAWNIGYETFCVAACVSTVFRRVGSHVFTLVQQLEELVVVSSLCVL